MSLYPPPTEIAAEVWTRLPDTFRRTGEVPDWAAANKAGHSADSFLEGPSFDRNGDLYTSPTFHTGAFFASRRRVSGRL